MSALIRPRRSVLFMPGGNARALEKAASLPADTLILDLEDAVSPDKKAEARAMIAARVSEKPYGAREVLVRLNGLGTQWFEDDVTALAKIPADGFVLPKVEHAQEVSDIVAALKAAGTGNDLSLWAMIETPRGVLNADAIAGADPELAGLIAGTSDLLKDLGAINTDKRAPLWMSLQMCVLAARAHGLLVLDGVHTDIQDQSGFQAACRQGRGFGFDGKTLIHPDQIADANATFGPSADEVSDAKGLIAAHKEAAEQGLGVTTFNGKLVEVLHVEEAERTLAMADAIRKLEQELS